MKTIGVLTSGGDAPGMNAAIRAVVRTGCESGMKVMGIRRGYKGLIEGDMFEMNLRSVSDIIHRGGTMLYSARCPEFAESEVQDKAVEVCKEFGLDGIVTIGGDGTFNETVTGLLESGLDLPIGYIPAGSTNDFAASLKLPLNPLNAAKAIVEGTPVSYDLGKFADRYFSYVASFGVFTKTSYATPQSVKNALGHTAYLLEGIQELSQLRKEHLRFEFDDRVIEDDFLFGAISNSTSVGGILTLDPKQVDMRDGKFELLLVRAPRDLMEVSECIMALQNKKYNFQ